MSENGKWKMTKGQAMMMKMKIKMSLKTIYQPPKRERSYDERTLKMMDGVEWSGVEETSLDEQVHGIQRYTAQIT